MKALVRIAGFGLAGVNTDAQPTLLEPGEWTWLENIDIESGDIRSAWGDTLVAANPPVVPTYIRVYEGADDTYLIISDGSLIYSFDGSLWVDITPETTPSAPASWDAAGSVGDGTWEGFATTWDTASTGGTSGVVAGRVSFDVFLGTLICCPSGGNPCYWPDVGERMVPLPGFDPSWRAQMIVSFSNFLVAIGLDDGAIEGSKYRVAWSDAAAEGEIPQEWLPSATNLAGSVQLRDTDGYLVTAKPLRGDLIIYKNDSIYQMFLRGDEFVMGTDRIINDRGCDSPDGVAALGAVHFFSDRGDIKAFNGQAVKSVAIDRIRERLTDGISNEFRDSTVLAAYPERDEIWVGAVPAGSTAISAVLVYNAIYDSWTLKMYPDAISMTLGPFTLPGTDSNGDSWDTILGSWDDQENSWNHSAFDPSEDSMIFGSPSDIWRADKTNTDFNEQPKACRAERMGFVIKGLSPNTTIRGVYPEIKGEAVVQISIARQFYPGGPVMWTPDKAFNPLTQKKLNYRVTGQPVGFRISSEVAEGWRLGALSFHAVEASGR